MRRTAASAETPPRVLIVMPDQWRRALLRAALREAGYDAVGAHGIRESQLVRPTVPERGPVRLIIIDQDALDGTDLAGVVALCERHGDPDIVLLARATIRPPVGPWRRVLRRPVSVADVVSAAEQLVPLPPELHHAIDAR